MARVSAATPAELESSPGELLAEEGATPAATDAIDAEDSVSLSRLRRCEVGRGGSSPHLVPPPPPPPPPPPVLLLLDADADDADGDDLAAPPPSKPPGARLLPLPAERRARGRRRRRESRHAWATGAAASPSSSARLAARPLGIPWVRPSGMLSETSVLGARSRDDDELARRRRARRSRAACPGDCRCARKGRRRRRPLRATIATTATATATAAAAAVVVVLLVFRGRRRVDEELRADARADGRADARAREGADPLHGAPPAGAARAARRQQTRPADSFFLGRLSCLARRAPPRLRHRNDGARRVVRGVRLAL